MTTKYKLEADYSGVMTVPFMEWKSPERFWRQKKENILNWKICQNVRLTCLKAFI
jgi:hypothetical protein